MVKPAFLFPVVVVAVRLVVLIVPSPLLAASSSPTAACTTPEIQALVGKLATAGEEQKKAIVALSLCSNATGALIWELENNPNVQARSAAGEVLGQIGTPEVIEDLTSALNEPDAMTRLYAAKTLGQIGWEAKSAVPALVRRVKQDSDPQVRSGAIQALSAISTASLDHTKQLQDWWQLGGIDELQSLQQQLDGLPKVLKDDKQDWPTKAQDLETLQLTQDQLQTQVEALEKQWLYQTVALVKGHPLWVGIGGILLGIGGVYLGVFVFQPLMLLKLGDKFIEDIAAIPHVGSSASQFLKTLSPLKYHPRVLDAWVEQHINNVTDYLLHKPTFERHKIHIAQPVFLQDNPSPVDFIPETFADIFKGQFRLVIWGEGGAGKTSLACQLANWAMWGRTKVKETYHDDKKLIKKLRLEHRMIPILIEEALGENSLLNAISGQLKEYTEEQISDELLRKLLQKRRVLVIVDHLSEIVDESTREKIRPSKDKEYPVNALIVTSRRKDILETEAVTFVQPRRITTENLAEFLNQYLPEKQEQEGMELAFNPNDYADAYKDLGNMISLRQAAETRQGEQPGATILLVTLYADQMIVEKQKREKFGNQYTTKQNLADNIPDLMLNYIDALSNKDASQKFPGAQEQPELQIKERLHQIAQLVAWKCLEKNYKPESVDRDVVVKALTVLASKDQAEQLNQLANAYLEYLSQITLIQFESRDRTLRLSLDPLAEYLAALHKFWEYRSDSDAWMGFLAQLEQQVANPEEVRGFLLALYDCCDKKGQKQPIEVPERVRHKLSDLAALDEAKVKAYYRERRMRLALEDLKEHNPTYQLRAITDLEKIAIDDRGLQSSAMRCLTEVLNDATREAQVRREAGKALRQLGEAIPLLVPEICAGVESLHLVSPLEALIINLSDSITLELVKIPAGSFWMGSEEEEGDDNERPRHEVQIAGFWMGRYPVTQAQWQIVAALPKVERELELNLSNLKGDDLPVERVSWFDVIEFCARLSQHFQPIANKKLTYRLPSEAEWEYACRAGTEMPYHFGDAITEELANFSGRNTPNQTTPVGQYGVANQFGLYDMHGNVWEWCADHWHGNYEGAPIDGSAWLTNNEEASRLLRGGSWYSYSRLCRSASRIYYYPDSRNYDLGFRVVCFSAWTL